MMERQEVAGSGIPWQEPPRRITGKQLIAKLEWLTTREERLKNELEQIKYARDTTKKELQQMMPGIEIELGKMRKQLAQQQMHIDRLNAMVEFIKSDESILVQPKYISKKMVS